MIGSDTDGLPAPADNWTLFDTHRQKVIGGTFDAEHLAWRWRDDAAFPEYIVPKRMSELPPA